MQVSNFPGDLLLRRIVSGNDLPANFPEPTEDSDEIELTLGLSLNGRFGLDPRAKLVPLKRSSSISHFARTPIREGETACRASSSTPSSYMVPLTRTCSLPTETEEEWRKRKELQSLRRMEAKRKRSEKQQHRNLSSKGDRERTHRDNCQEEDKVVDEFRAMGMPTWVSGGGGGCGGDKGKCGVPPPSPPAVAAGSLGSCSSGIKESESQGVHKCIEARSTADVPSSPKNEKEPLVTPRRITIEKSGQFSGIQMENNCNKPTVPENGANEIVKNVLENMPCVSTIGDGPNGKRIEGFLYRYKKGEEVRIVCVCHGSFLSPAEFVKHGGGGDVAHPLKHIVVNPTPFL